MKELGELVDFGLSIAKSYEGVMADGKVGLDDVGHALAPLTLMPAAITDAAKAKDELKAMSADDRKAFMDEKAAAFDLADDEVEAKIESAIDYALHTVQFLGRMGILKS